MEAESALSFGPFRLDTSSQRLFRGAQVVKLTTKAFGVLHHLLAHPGRVVTKDELFTAVWPGVVVSDAALTVVIGEVRRALRDKGAKPRYIQAVYGQGYRFIAEVPGSTFQVPGADTQHSVLVGRETELTHLQGWLEKALTGQRQIGFITGEAGIGKTTLVDAFRQRLETGDRRLAPSSQAPGVWLGWGQCIEQYGSAEAYRPVLEALGRLCRGVEGKRLIALLEKHAPTWLIQMPTLLSSAKLKTLQSKTQGTTKDRMLRELAEALDAITAAHPLVLVLEDLHWSDHSTLDLLSVLARRREAARLLVLGTYRPIDVIVAEHPLKKVKQELQAHGQCEELALGYLSETDIEAYLATRFPVGATGRSPLQSLTQLLYQRTDGTPLFMVALVDYFVTHGVLVQADGQWVLSRSPEEIGVSVPDTLRQLIGNQFDSLAPEDQQLLEVASVAGVEFTSGAVAVGVERPLAEVEQRCEHLLRRSSLLHARGVVEWPDDTLVARYSFQHALYQNVLYDRLSETRRIR